MDRRTFLKAATAAIAAAQFPSLAEGATPSLAEGATPRLDVKDQVRLIAAEMKERDVALREVINYSEFNPKVYYGDVLQVTYQPSPDTEKRMLDTLWRHMCRIVPPPYRDRVYLHTRDSDYGSGLQIAWKYHPPGTPTPDPA